MKKKIFITGGAGFIGEHIVNLFVQNNHDITVFDINEPAYHKEGIKFIKGNIFDLEKLQESAIGSDVLIHMVGLANAGICQKNPMKSFELNVISLQNVLEVCRTQKIKKIIFPSSAAVYGMTEEIPIRETTPLNVTGGVYANHKFICEEMIKAYSKLYGIQYVILRLFNVYGKGNEGVIGLFLNKARNNEIIQSFGPYQYRDFIYTGDVAKGFYTSAMYNKAINKTVNLGSGKGIQIRDIIEFICEIYPDTRWKEVDNPNLPLYDSIADITLAKILLDFEPDVSSEKMKNIVLTEMM